MMRRREPGRCSAPTNRFHHLKPRQRPNRSYNFNPSSSRGHQPGSLDRKSHVVSTETTEIFGGSPAHAVAENGIAVLECRRNAGMAVRLVMMPMFAIAFAFCVGGISVGANRAVANVFAIHVEDDETLRSAKMVRNGHAVSGSDCDLHTFPFRL